MRTLSEITEAIKDNEPTTHDECRYAALMLCRLLAFASMDMVRLAEHVESPLVERAFIDQFYRERRAWNADPLAWLGDNIPENQEHQRFRAAGKRILDHVLASEEATHDG